MWSADSLRNYPYASRRSAVLATGGVVATSQPLAAQAGIGVLADGGSAIDASIATAAALTVLEPCSNGLGGDAFALVHDGDQLHGINGSGRWPMANEAQEHRDAGKTSVPLWGWPGVTVPGAVDMWAELHARFGKLPMDRLLAPAIRYAEHGFPISPVAAIQWEHAHRRYPGLGLDGTDDWATVFAPEGAAPDAGDLWASPGHARGLKALATRGLRDFYEGEIAEAITNYAAATGGRLSADDLASHKSEWVDPISVPYGDYEVWEIPPNGQGIAALLALGIASNTDAAKHPQLDPASWHLHIEAMKLAFADSDRYVGDQQHSTLPVTELLDPAYLAGRAAMITDTAGQPIHGEPQRGGTVYLCAADADGQMVSFIQSNYHGFGSGVVVPSHGISLQNRGAGFTLEEGHPNEAAPGKRPRHTIIPGFLTRGGRAIGPFGVMGGEMQPQGHLQVVSGMIDHGLNPQAALDAPRWQIDRTPGPDRNWPDRNWRVRVERETPPEIVAALESRGHHVVIEPTRLPMGRGQIIWRNDNGVYAAGSEPRADGAALGI